MHVAARTLEGSTVCRECGQPLYVTHDGDFYCVPCRNPTYGGMLDLTDAGDGHARCCHQLCGYDGPPISPGNTFCPRCERLTPSQLPVAVAAPERKRPPLPPRKQRKKRRK